VASGEQKLEARLPLSPLLSQRIVGPLVPLMVEVEKAPGMGPLSLAVSDFRLPLDGNLSGLDANVRLELGEVAFQLLPGLSQALAQIGEQIARQTATIERIDLRIDRGVARYSDLPIDVGGHRVTFDGAFDLASRRIDFEAQVPLAILGHGVARELDKVRDYIDPDVAVPLEVEGDWKRPKISIGKSFLDTVVKQAAEGALKRGLRDLLEKELGGDD
jgi:hypothetical protein